MNKLWTQIELTNVFEDIFNKLTESLKELITSKWGSKLNPMFYIKDFDSSKLDMEFKDPLNDSDGSLIAIKLIEIPVKTLGTFTQQTEGISSQQSFLASINTIYLQPIIKHVKEKFSELKTTKNFNIFIQYAENQDDLFAIYLVSSGAEINDESGDIIYFSDKRVTSFLPKFENATYVEEEVKGLEDVEIYAFTSNESKVFKSNGIFPNECDVVDALKPIWNAKLIDSLNNVINTYKRHMFGKFKNFRMINQNQFDNINKFYDVLNPSMIKDCFKDQYHDSYDLIYFQIKLILPLSDNIGTSDENTMFILHLACVKNPVKAIGEILITGVKACFTYEVEGLSSKPISLVQIAKFEKDAIRFFIDTYGYTSRVITPIEDATRASILRNIRDLTGSSHYILDPKVFKTINEKIEVVKDTEYPEYVYQDLQSVTNKLESVVRGLKFKPETVNITKTSKLHKGDATLVLGVLHTPVNANSDKYTTLENAALLISEESAIIDTIEFDKSNKDKILIIGHIRK